MTKIESQDQPYMNNAAASPEERIVYVMPQDPALRNSAEEIGLIELWDILWAAKWPIIAITALFAVASVTYALLATEWYRAEALLAPATKSSVPSLGAELGGLAALAGVTTADDQSIEAVATLQSRELARAFIEDFQLLTVLFSDDWDPVNGRWYEDDPEDWPDIRDAVEFFQEDILTVTQDDRTGLVTMTVDWTDPEVAAVWANELIKRVNARLRERALREAETNVAYLQKELAGTSVVTLQQTIGGLLETELQKLMLAKGNEDYAFRLIDRPEAPKDKVSPKRALIAVLSTLIGGLIGIAISLVAFAYRKHHART